MSAKDRAGEAVTEAPSHPEAVPAEAYDAYDDGFDELYGADQVF